MLALNSQLIDIGQVIREAQVEHTVSFVNYQKLNLIQLNLHGALQIKQTTRRGHHEVGVLQLGNLQLIRHATHNIRNAQATAMLNQIDRVMGNLLSQLTCWANNQGTGSSWGKMTRIGWILALGTLGRCLAFGCRLGNRLFKIRLFFGFCLRHLSQQGVQHRQQEGGCLTTASLAGDHQVGETSSLVSSAVALHGDWNSFQLYCCGLGESQILDRLNQFRCQAKGHEAIWNFSHSHLNITGLDRHCNAVRCLDSVN